MAIQLTQNEQAVMQSLAYNDYGDSGTGGVWSWAVNNSDRPSGLEGKALAGVVGSLCKKGLLRSEEYDKGEDVLWFTQAGEDYCTALLKDAK